MSADLFAEFGAPPVNTSAAPSRTQQQQQPPPIPQSVNFFDNPQTPVTGSGAAFQFGTSIPSNQGISAEDNDDWGDFEGPTAFESGQQNILLNKPPQINQVQNPAPIPRVRDPNVLFDATDLDDDDDFGDFEEPESVSNAPIPQSAVNHSTRQDLVDHRPPQPTALEPQKNVDLLSSNIKPERKSNSISSSQSPNKFGSFGFTSQSKNPEPGRVSPSKQIRKEHKPSLSSTTKSADPWDTFDDWEASLPAPTSKPKSPTPSQSSVPLPLSPTTADVPPSELPPTNVPPPSTLLSLFPPIFSSAQTTLFKPMASQPLPMRNKLLSNPKTLSFLQSYLVLASVAAHIIAGRKLRWKRDVHLSQGMKIGPASSRGTSGMKLAGIEKGEAMKEERDVLDVVTAWREQLGRLRHVVAAANAGRPGVLGPVPELSETLHVKTLKEAEGGIPAPKPCMLCGLKREERVEAVDQGVEDSFGEWWIDQVNMHRVCRNFWQEHKATLQQR